MPPLNQPHQAVSTQAPPRGREDGAEPPLWRTLDELAATAHFEELLYREFPHGAGEWGDEASRRQFLKLMGASLALAGVYGCAEAPRERIVPYVDPPERIVPGKPLFFATALEMNGYGIGVLVESHMGRPTKIEGNPRHPASLGATTALAQSAVLQLYDPQRSKVALRRGKVSDWGRFLTELGPVLERQRAKGGSGLRLLTRAFSSPTLADQVARLMRQYPGAHWHTWDPLGRDHVHEGARLAFGRPLQPIWQFDRARVIVSLDADFLFDDPGSLRYARAFIDGRRVASGAAGMNRLYVVEPTPTITGSMADHRLAVGSADVHRIARALAAAVNAPGAPPAEGPLPPGQARWVSAVAADLRAHAGHGLVLAGHYQPPAVHALAHVINGALGNQQAAVFTAPVVAQPTSGVPSLRELTAAMAAGEVDALIIVGGNPAYDAPADIGFAEQLLALSARGDGGAPSFTAHLGLYHDETAFLCQWHLPQAHTLETWSDVRADNGLVSIIQPLIAPLYRGRSAHEVLAALAGEAFSSAYDVVRAYWGRDRAPGEFEESWHAWLEQGMVPGTELPAEEAQVQAAVAWPPAPAAAEGLEIVFRPDPTVWDGSFAHVAWQQELPKPFTKLTWDNAALIAPGTAERLGLANEEMVRLRLRGRSVEAPVWILPGQADGVVTLHLGYGARRPGLAEAGHGCNAYAVRSADHAWFDHGLELERAGQQARLASTSAHHLIAAVAGIRPEPVSGGPVVAEGGDDRHNRRLVRTGSLQQYRDDPHFVHAMDAAGRRPLLSLYPEYAYEGYKWGMVIDLGACIGCNACVAACQAENNIPVVGKNEILRGREMHWLRIDTYFSGSPEAPGMYHQPVPCMHCEQAPCEVVCPVNATVHDSEGLNEMIYNRCVGTRYCSNNCPYKVRRFNFLQYSESAEPTLKMQKNPDVTVRGRGVMEKCTYCVQRISAARIEAEKQNRRIHDGEFTTACAQACPTRAITFGDLNDPNAEVVRLKNSPLNYGMLTELSTQPRTTYLARLRNPNPALAEEPGT